MYRSKCLAEHVDRRRWTRRRWMGRNGQVGRQRWGSRARRSSSPAPGILLDRVELADPRQRGFHPRRVKSTRLVELPPRVRPAPYLKDSALLVRELLATGTSEPPEVLRGLVRQFVMELTANRARRDASALLGGIARRPSAPGSHPLCRQRHRASLRDRGGLHPGPRPVLWRPDLRRARRS
jgi:hypothetical protein